MVKVKRHRKPVRRDKGALSLLEFFIITLSVILIIVFGITNGFELNTSDQWIQVDTEYDYNVTATMYGKDISGLFRTEGIVNTHEIGQYTIKYAFNVFKFLPGFERKVYVVDVLAPEILLKGDSEVHLYDINRYEEAGFSAYDSYDGDLTEKVYIELERVSENQYHQKYYCVDSNGNKGVATRVIYIDPPVGEVYLTFDDGPSNVTKSILQILNEKQVKATFFISGYTQTKEYYINQEYEAGHTIALHGLSHDYSEIYISSEAAIRNFDNLRLLIKENLGIDAYIVRFPGGSSNTVSKNYCKGVMTEATQQVLEQGYVYFDWNVDSEDTGGANTAEEVYQNVINGIKPGRANVVLMHDSYGHEFTAEAVPKIIDWCLENGYLVKAIDKTTPVVTHNVNN